MDMLHAGLSVAELPLMTLMVRSEAAYFQRPCTRLHKTVEERFVTDWLGWKTGECLTG